MRRENGRFWTKYDKVQQAEPTEVVSNLDGSLYAVLFNANEGRHSNDLRLVYHSLIDVGVSDQNISILEGEGRTQNRFVDKPATIRGLESAVDSIRQKANPNDRLLIHVTNEGYLVNGQCTFKAYDGTISEKDFEEMVQDLPVNFGLFYFAQCHSGGFAERMGYGRNIGMSNTDKEGFSYGQRDLGADFTHFLFPTILRAIPIEESFDYAVKADTAFLKRQKRRWKDKKDKGETPQLRWQNADPSQLYLISTK